jgi:hypothetical protein
VCVGAKHPGMSRLAVVGARCGRTGQQHTCTVGMAGARGMSHWRGMRWMPCVTRYSDHRGIKSEPRAPSLAAVSSVNFMHSCSAIHLPPTTAPLFRVGSCDHGSNSVLQGSGALVQG